MSARAKRTNGRGNADYVQCDAWRRTDVIAIGRLQFDSPATARHQRGPAVPGASDRTSAAGGRDPQDRALVHDIARRHHRTGHRHATQVD